jgi:cold shock CspA family protein
MAKSQETFNKKEKEKKRLKKRQEKENRKQERKANSGKGGGFDSMIAYVDEFGNITDTPPDRTKRIEIDPESISVSTPKRLASDEPTGRSGRVEFFNDQKGYGFIKDLLTQDKYFVHINGLIDEIKENDKVTFELERGPKGMNAVKVKKV